MVHSRRAEITAAVIEHTGIDETMIDRLVRSFYERVKADEILAPIFAARITQWEPHLERMRSFWSSVALWSGRYHGDPMQMHLGLPIDARHFDRWLMLFELTARELCPHEAAEHFIGRARRIARSLELGIAAREGRLLAPGERLGRSERPHHG